MRIRSHTVGVWAALGCLLALAAPVAAAPPPPPEPLGVHALTGVRIVVAPGRVVENGTVVIRDGLIEAAGAAVSPPPDARVWEGEELTVYAGWIDAYVARDWPQDEETDDDPGTGYPNRQVRPERSAADVGLERGTVTGLREAGFTTALVAPRGGVVRGWSAALNLGDGPVRENLLLPRVTQNVTIEGSGSGGYPSSTMGAYALTRQAFLDAGWYQRAWAVYADHSDQRRPPRDAALAALGPAAAGPDAARAPVVFATDDLLDVLRAGAVAAELGLDAWLVGSGEEYRRLEQVAGLGRPILLPVAFPEAPDAGDDLDVELDDLRHWKRAPENPAALVAAGVTVALTATGLDSPSQIHERLGKAVAAGLDPEAALASLTTVPAGLLGLGDRLGTVEAGKIANLIVAEGDLFGEEAGVRAVWVDGRRYEIEEREPPEIEPAGTWELTIDAGGQTVLATLVLTGTAPSLDGTLTAQGVTLDLESAEVSGSTIKLAFDGSPFGMAGGFNLSFTVDGERGKGSGTGPPGPFTLKGRRTAKPPESLPMVRTQKEDRR